MSFQKAFRPLPKYPQNSMHTHTHTLNEHFVCGGRFEWSAAIDMCRLINYLSIFDVVTQIACCFFAIPPDIRGALHILGHRWLFLLFVFGRSAHTHIFPIDIFVLAQPKCAVYTLIKRSISIGRRSMAWVGRQ